MHEFSATIELMTSQTWPLDLEYRPLIKKFYRIVVWSTLLAELVIIRVNIFEITEGSWWQGVLRLVLASTVPLSIWLRAYFFIRPRLFSQYELHPDCLKIRFKRKETEIHFSNVTHVRISWLPPRYFGGFIAYTKSGQRLVFLSILYNNHKILEQILKTQDELQADNRIQQYLLEARLVELSWQRVFEKWRKWPYLVFKYFGYALLWAIAGHLYGVTFTESSSGFDNVLTGFVVFTIVGLVLALTLNHFEEKALNRFATKATDSQISRIPDKETPIRIIVSVAFYIITASLYYFVLVQLK